MLNGRKQSDHMQMLREALESEHLTSPEKLDAMTKHGLLLNHSVRTCHVDVLESTYKSLEPGVLYHFDRVIEWLMGVKIKEVTISEIPDDCLY